MIDQWLKDNLLEAVRTAVREVAANKTQEEPSYRRWVSLDEAERQFDVSKKTLSRWIRSGCIDAIGKKSLTRIDPLSVERYLRSMSGQKGPTTSDIRQRAMSLLKK